MVFEPTVAPRDPAAFEAWYEQQTQWAEGHSYNDPVVTSPALQRWFADIIKTFPPMSGPLASSHDDSSVTDHCIGRHVIYSAFAGSQGARGYTVARELAQKHSVGFYSCSESPAELLFPDSAR
jgi:hypothetical protein